MQRLSAEEQTALRFHVFERDGWRCRVPWCGRRTNLEAHHVVPRSLGGQDTEENLVTVCHWCHVDRTENRLAITPVEFVGMMGSRSVRLEFRKLS